jgi:hypothetical protein
MASKVLAALSGGQQKMRSFGVAVNVFEIVRNPRLIFLFSRKARECSLLALAPVEGGKSGTHPGRGEE